MAVAAAAHTPRSPGGTGHASLLSTLTGGITTATLGLSLNPAGERGRHVSRRRRRDSRGGRLETAVQRGGSLRGARVGSATLSSARQRPVCGYAIRAVATAATSPCRSCALLQPMDCSGKHGATPLALRLRCQRWRRVAHTRAGAVRMTCDMSSVRGKMCNFVVLVQTTRPHNTYIVLGTRIAVTPPARGRALRTEYTDYTF